MRVPIALKQRRVKEILHLRDLLQDRIIEHPFGKVILGRVENSPRLLMHHFIPLEIQHLASQHDQILSGEDLVSVFERCWLIAQTSYFEGVYYHGALSGAGQALLVHADRRFRLVFLVPR